MGARAIALPPRGLETAARADLCRFLSACYCEPGPVFAEEKLFESMAAAAGRVDGEVAAHVRRLSRAFASEDAGRLLVDYTRLFLAPGGALAQPYESFWREEGPVLMGESAVSVLELYREAGFAVDEGLRDLPDHIACELEFLYLMLHRESHARARGDHDAMDEAARLRKRFLDEHLAAWVRPFTAAVGAGAGTPFYRELAALTECFVTSEAERAAAGPSA